jgi:hypothetical protein
VLDSLVPPARSCRVRVRDADGVLHEVEVAASSLYEAAAAALAAFRQEPWAAAALTPNATFRVEVRLPPVVHDVPLKAVERWLRTPSVSPREAMTKRRSPT